MTTERFCDELVGEMENFGQWSDGTNSVSKLQSSVNRKRSRDLQTNLFNRFTLVQCLGSFKNG